MANDVTITITVEGTPEAIAKLGLVGDASKKAADQQSGAWSKLNSSITGLIGKIPYVGSAIAKLGPATIPVFLEIAGAAAALIGYLSSIIPELVAAGLGVGAFGALAMPIFSKITTAVTALGTATTKTARDKAWDAVPAALQPALRTILQIKAAWDSMSKSMTPLVSQIVNTAADIVKKLLPLVRPFAVEAGKAIEGLLKQFDKIAGSQGFKSFMAEMAKLSGPAITAIGQGFIEVGKQIATFIRQLTSPNGIIALKAIFAAITLGIRGLGDALQGFGAFSTWFTKLVINQWLALAKSLQALFDGIIGAAGHFLDFMSKIPGPLQSTFRRLANDVLGFRNSVDQGFNQAIATLNNWKTTVTNAPKIVKLQADISQLQAKLYIARQNLNNPDLTKTRTAQIQANISQLQNALATARAQLAALNGTTATTYVITQTSPIQGPHAAGGIIGAQGGGPRSRFTLVGEHGPELVSLPPGSMVHSNPDTQRMMSQATGATQRGELVVHGGGSEFEQFMARFIRKFVRVHGGGDVQVAFGQH